MQTNTCLIPCVMLQTTALPSSPAELLRYISSDSYKQAQRELQERMSRSYEVGPTLSVSLDCHCVKLTMLSRLTGTSMAAIAPLDMPERYQVNVTW
jgi:hypothetical protein